MTKLKITVTKEILERSKNCDGDCDTGYNCAVALAVRDIFPKAWVDADEIFPLYYDYAVLGESMPKAYNIRLPKTASDFIIDFDRSTPEIRVKMKPISFEIEIPDSVIERINIDELKPLLTNHPTLELVEVNQPA